MAEDRIKKMWHIQSDTNPKTDVFLVPHPSVCKVLFFEKIVFYETWLSMNHDDDSVKFQSLPCPHDIKYQKIGSDKSNLTLVSSYYPIWLSVRYDDDDDDGF